ncbi:MAG: serine hydrolase [Holosporales bacterium]|jgi:CubicO group peptidase (beta-lactamase class C family)|nr:serine hydrolase [Holosporales bacterium]
MFRILSRVLVPGSLALAFIVVSHSKISDEEALKAAQATEKVVVRSLEKAKVPGCSFIIVRGGKTIYESHVGNANLKGEKVGSTHLYPLSSLSKLVTAIVLLAIVDDGKINLDDYVRKYIPNFFIANETISSKFTVRDLVSHRSGLPHFIADSLWQAGYPREKIMNALRYVKDVSGFRKKYGYQNVIFGIVEDVMTNATGLTYEELLDKYLVSKMGLKNITAKPLHTEKSLLENFKYNYKQKGVWHAIKNIFSYKKADIVDTHSIYLKKTVTVPHTDYFQRMKATGGIGANLHDFGEILKMMLNKGKSGTTQIISERGFKEITSNQVNLSAIKESDYRFPVFRLRDSYYGIGSFNSEYFEKDGPEDSKTARIFFHMGGVCGVCTFFAFCPEEDVAMAAFCNLGGNGVTLFAEMITFDFLDRCLGFKEFDWIKFESDEIAKHDRRKIRWAEDLKNKKPGPHADIDKYEGTYTSDVYGNVKISKSNNGLVLEILDKKVRLTHHNANIFKFPMRDLCQNFLDRNEYVLFYMNKYGNFEEMLITNLSENNTTFKKLPAK